MERISQLEQRHGELLKQLPAHLQQHYWSRHKQVRARWGSLPPPLTWAFAAAHAGGASVSSVVACWSQAIQEGGGEGSGRWVFPPLILDEEAFRQDLDEEG